jgi:hypothetical protein
MARPKDIPYVCIVEVDGEQHVLKGTGSRDQSLVTRHLQQIHPDMKILSIVPADPKDPIGHLQRVKRELEEKFPGQEPLTPERLNESIAAANEAKNAAAAEKLS